MRADKFLKFETNCLFAKGCGSKFKASELNLCKNHIGECLSYRSFLPKFNCKNSRFSFDKYRCFRLCFVTQSVYLKKPNRKTSLFTFAKDRIYFAFSITFGSSLLVNLIDKSKFYIRAFVFVIV